MSWQVHASRQIGEDWGSRELKLWGRQAGEHGVALAQGARQSTCGMDRTTLENILLERDQTDHRRFCGAEIIEVSDSGSRALLFPLYISASSGFAAQVCRSQAQSGCMRRRQKMRRSETRLVGSVQTICR